MSDWFQLLQWQDAVTYTGLMRIYFNRHQAAPLVWCIMPDSEDWELAVAAVHFEGISVCSIYTPKETDDAEDGKPSGWFQCYGTLTFEGMTAVIRE